MFSRKKKETQQEKEITSDEPHFEDISSIQEKKKKRFPLVIKILSGTLALASVALLCYSVFLLINESSSNANSDTYIALNGKSIQESKEIYSQFGLEKKKKAADYALIGTKFYISETKITPSLLSTESTSFFSNSSNVFLYNLTLDQPRFSLGQSDSQNHQYYIDLQNVEEGDFLVYSSTGPFSSKKDYHPYSLLTNISVNYETYSLPDSDGIRKRITIKNNRESPFLLLSIKKCGSTLPTKYYDAVIYSSEYKKEGSSIVKEQSYTKDEWANIVTDLENQLPTRFKIKYASSMQEAYETNAALSIAISKNDGDYMSIFSKTDLIKNYQTDALEDTNLKGYDRIPEIREMLGYLGHAGENVLNVIGNDIQTTSDNHIGKDSYLLKKDEDINKKIISILES